MKHDDRCAIRHQWVYVLRERQTRSRVHDNKWHGVVRRLHPRMEKTSVSPMITPAPI